MMQQVLAMRQLNRRLLEPNKKKSQTKRSRYPPVGQDHCQLWLKGKVGIAKRR
jgi:hypothetical protein